MQAAFICDCTPHFVQSAYKSTGKERDTESGNDDFGTRYYASSMGRFLSPDWSAKIMPVPYAKLDNPQSLNLCLVLKRAANRRRCSFGREP
jgi:RHS repeat-associated protein